MTNMADSDGPKISEVLMPQGRFHLRMENVLQPEDSSNP